MILLLATAAWAECPADPLGEALIQAGKVEGSYTNMDDAKFAEARGKLDAAMACMTSELSPPDAVAIHRARAIGSFVDGEESASRRSWLAVKSLQPDWQPSADLMPAGHPMRKLWETPMEGGSPMVPQELAPPGGWSVDGTRQNMVPAQRAYVLQGFSATGAVVYTGYLYQASEVPTSLPVDLVPTRRVHADGNARRNAHVIGSATAGALVIGGVGSLLVGSSFANQADEATDDLEATKLLGRSRTAAVAGYGLLGAGVVVGAATWVVPW